MGEAVAKKQRKIYRLVVMCINIYKILGVITITSMFFGYFKREYFYKLWEFEAMYDFPWFDIMNLVQIYISITAALILIATDSILYILLAFCYCQMIMLKEALKSLEFSKIDEPVEEEKVYKLLKSYIEYYSKLLE